MTGLADTVWRRKYTPEDGDLVQLFYLPALNHAVRYDRLTGYFNANALTLAARGIEGLIRHHGHMRLIVGCTLAPAEVAAIERGEQLKTQLEQRLVAHPLTPLDDASRDALELLAWMVAHGILDVKVAVPCDAQRRPLPADGLFHEKAGILEDAAGHRIAWNGSLNETAAGWQYNWESINVFTSWGQEPRRVSDEESNFARLWADRARRVITLDVPMAARQDLLRFLPADDRPARLRNDLSPPRPAPRPAPDPDRLPPLADPRRLVWGFIRAAPSLPNGGERVGEATAAVAPWPHQLRAFQRLYQHWPPNLLIADEVGLGKTIQAGLLLRQAWLSGRARRILILAPKAVLRQWQIELREKFNLNWPIYDGQKLTWYPSPAWRDRNSRGVTPDAWHREPVVIASSHLLRRQSRAADLLDHAEPWDVLVLDEAHHARRKAAGAVNEGGPNALLRLLQGLRAKTQGLILLTATPMQVHPIEVWDLLNLLGLPPAWSAPGFLQYFADLADANPAPAAWERLAPLFQAVEQRFGPLADADAIRITGLGRLKTLKILRALRDPASIPRRQLETAERRAALQLLRANTPIRHLVSRHTRELLRRYYRAGLLATPIAERQVEDSFIDLSPAERGLYEAVERYIATTYRRATPRERTAVGFVMTLYRRRLASSFHALGHTLQARLAAVRSDAPPAALAGLDEDTPDDETADDILDADDAADLERQARAFEERADIAQLLQRIQQLPPDSKSERLKAVLADLRAAGYAQVMVFTQYTDTMDFLRDELKTSPDLRLLCFSGRGGEAPRVDGTWTTVTRDDVKRRFKAGLADVLLCTDAAAEGLNFQFCGALINYDMPWNPMRVEQRIGRIDRLGQRYRTLRIVNLHYEGTVETDVYRALRNRIGLFQAIIGRLQPILSQLPRRITAAVLTDSETPAAERARLVSDLNRDVDSLNNQAGFDLDDVTADELTLPARPDPVLDLDDLDRLLHQASLLPAGVAVSPLADREYAYQAPGMAQPVRVTTDIEFYEANADSVELWSPGNPLFPGPDMIATGEDAPSKEGFHRLLAAVGDP